MLGLPQRSRCDACPPGVGQALVEAALVFPVLLLIMLAVVDFGRAYYTGVALMNAAREGARVGVDVQTSDATIRQRVKDAALPVVVSDSQITITPSPRGPANSGQPIRVQVAVPVQLYTAFLAERLGFAAITVRGDAQMVMD
jgi:Flp pilus assembly protein TadG